MTDIGVYTQPFQAENLSWDLTPPHGGFDRNGTLDLTLFTAAQHFPNGYIPSGTVLGKNTTSGLLGPYLDAASDGRQTAVGVLKASVTAVQPSGTTKAKVGCAYRVHAIVDPARLPFTSGTAAAGGYLDANGQADLKLIHFAS